MQCHPINSALILGIVEGLTEFLPVSSTGHMLAIQSWFQLDTPEGKLFDMSIQLGSILAVCLIYWDKLWFVTTHFHRDFNARRFVLFLATAFIPTAIVGLFFHDMIRTYLFSTQVVAISLIIGGIIIFIIEYIKPRPRYKKIERFSFGIALAIGLCQTLAMIPGVSRSGATIMGAIVGGVDRKTAVEFSFFLAIPTMIAATGYSLLKHATPLSQDQWMILGTGFATAFVTAMIVIRIFLAFISSHSFVIFGWYRILFGLLLLLFV